MQEAGHSVGRAAAGNSKGQGSQTLSPPHLEFVGFIFCCVERGLKKCNKMKKKSSCRGTYMRLGARKTHGQRQGIASESHRGILNTMG